MLMSCDARQRRGFPPALCCDAVRVHSSDKWARSGWFCRMANLSEGAAVFENGEETVEGLGFLRVQVGGDVVDVRVEKRQGFVLVRQFPIDEIPQ